MCAAALVAIHAFAQSAAPTPYDSLQSFLGRKIATINIQGSSTLPADKALAVVRLKTGDVLTRTALADSIQALYNTGFYRDISVEAADASDSRIALTFVTTENYFVGTIWITGAPKAPPTTVQLVNSTKLQLGELVTPEKIQSTIAGIRQSLQTNGYHQAEVIVAQHAD